MKDSMMYAMQTKGNGILLGGVCGGGEKLKTVSKKNKKHYGSGGYVYGIREGILGYHKDTRNVRIRSLTSLWKEIFDEDGQRVIFPTLSHFHAYHKEKFCCDDEDEYEVDYMLSGRHEWITTFPEKMVEINIIASNQSEYMILEEHHTMKDLKDQIVKQFFLLESFDLKRRGDGNFISWNDECNISEFHQETLILQLTSMMGVVTQGHGSFGASSSRRLVGIHTFSEFRRPFHSDDDDDEYQMDEKPKKKQKRPAAARTTRITSSSDDEEEYDPEESEEEVISKQRKRWNRQPIIKAIEAGNIIIDIHEHTPRKTTIVFLFLRVPYEKIAKLLSLMFQDIFKKAIINEPYDTTQRDFVTEKLNTGVITPTLFNILDDELNEFHRLEINFDDTTLHEVKSGLRESRSYFSDIFSPYIIDYLLKKLQPQKIKKTNNKTSAGCK